MEQRDIIKDQIEQLGKVLGKILADFLGLQSEGQALQGIEMANQNFKLKLEIDIESLISLEKDEVLNYLKQRKLTAEHIELIAEYISEMGQYTIQNDRVKAKKILEKALELFELTDEVSKTVSFERLTKKTKIEKVLQQYNE